MANQLLDAIGQAMYLFSPLLATAALSGVVLRRNWWSKLARPIDGGLTVRDRALFGTNKTWRGLVCSVVGCVTFVAVQKYVIGDAAGRLAVIDYGSVSAIAVGGVLGVGAILGELPNSFLKRQLDAPPGLRPRGVLGAVFYVADQLDPLLFTWPLLLIWLKPTATLVLSSVLVVFAAHQVVSLVGYAIGARGRWS